MLADMPWRVQQLASQRSSRQQLSVSWAEPWWASMAQQREERPPGSNGCAQVNSFQLSNWRPPWGLAPRALASARQRGEVFALVVHRRRFYPREFLHLNRDDIATACKALEGLTPVEQFFFWKRPHGALQGKTVPDALVEFGLPRVAGYARSQTAQVRAAAAAGS